MKKIKSVLFVAWVGLLVLMAINFLCILDSDLTMTHVFRIEWHGVIDTLYKLVH
jgi:hypothetical protein